MFRGSGKHVACSYSCFAYVSYIELYEEPTSEGAKLIGIRLIARDGTVVASVGYVGSHFSMLTNDAKNFNDAQKIMLGERTNAPPISKLITINEFERIVGV